MPKTFIHELPLQTTPRDEAVLDVRLDAARNLYNACLQESLKRLDLMRESKTYRLAVKMQKGQVKTDAFKLCKQTHRFNTYAIHAYAVVAKNSCWIGDHLDVHVVQKIASRAFDAVEKYAFGKRGRPRFKRKGWLTSIEGKSNATGIRWRDGRVLWNGLNLKPRFDFKDKHGIEAHALGKKVKYLRLVKRIISGKIRWYVQLVSEGAPHQKEKNSIRQGIVGIDIGPSTIGVVAEDDAFLTQFCDEVMQPWREIRRQQRAQDRSRRATNLENYNADGTIKKGSKKWYRSNRYQKRQRRMTELQRKLAATRKKQHGELCNRIISLGNIVKAEKLSYKAFQKNYGRSVAVRAPGMFMTELTRKAANAGGEVQNINTRTTRLSQTCICGNVKKKQLSERHHNCECGVTAQRDLFSAFLARYCSSNTLDIHQAKSGWSAAEPLLRRAMSRLNETASRRRLPASFGTARRQSCSPVTDGAAAVEAVDVVAVVALPSGSVNQREPRKDCCFAVRTPWL